MYNNDKKPNQPQPQGNFPKTEIPKSNIPKSDFPKQQPQPSKGNYGWQNGNNPSKPQW